MVYNHFMQIRTEIHHGEWNQFIAENSSPSSFLQTYEWGEFQKSLGFKIHRFAVTGEAGEYLAVAQAIVRPLHFGKTYLEVTKGPVMQVVSNKLISCVFEELRRIGKKENSVLIRINPPYESGLQLTTYNFTPPEILLRQMEPQDTVLVDLTKTEDELLENMHEKSRYNIRLAKKKGVKIEEKTKDSPAFDKFIELIGETARRDGIAVWPRSRFEKFRQQFMLGDYKSRDPRAILLTGEFEGKILAASIIMLFGDSGTYLYAASSSESRNANVPSLALWEAIRQSKLAGKKYYDMWGIAPAGADEDHSWAGITRFKSRYIKSGKTGVERHCIGTWDLVVDKKYHTLFRVAKKIKTLFKR